MRVGVVIPALNESASVGDIVRRCLDQCADGDEMRVVVCDNASTDDTADVAREAGAEVVAEPHRGYGAACLAAITSMGKWPDVIAFIDADGSSLPEEIERLLAPIRREEADLVMGRRQPSPGAMTPQQHFGGWLATRLIALRWGVRYADLGPFRAIRRDAYERLGMSDRTWGWTVEMQILAAIERLRIEEVEVSWERRVAGESKISGNIVGVLRAGFKILYTIGRFLPRRRSNL